jgi:hypothetical protein
MDKDQFLIMQKTDLEVLLKELLNQISPKEVDEWVIEPVAMKMLGIKSKSHLWKLRSEGLIEFSQPSRKVILYKTESLRNYIESHTHKIF